MAKIGLAALQPKLSLEHFQSERAFQRWVEELAEKAVSQLSSARELILCYPEAMGLPFFATLFPRAAQEPTLKKALGATLRHIAPALAPLFFRARGSLLRAFYLFAAQKRLPLYLRVFAKTARTFSAYVVAGSFYTPPLEWESSRFFFTDWRARNTSFLFSPQGKLLGSVTKCHLIHPDETRAKFSPGSPSELRSFSLSFGKIGILICYDAFHETLVQKLDAEGTQILVQPSFNTEAWNAPWKQDPRITQERAWLRDGIRKMVQQRENIKIGINPMLVGSFFELSAEGKSAIVARAELAPESPADYPGILAMAETPTEEEVVTALV